MPGRTIMVGTDGLLRHRVPSGSALLSQHCWRIGCRLERGMILEPLPPRGSVTPIEEDEP